MSRKNVAFASKNPGKVREVRFILAKLGFSVDVIEVDKTEIQADDSAEIASESARRLFSEVHRPFFVEDAGLYVDSLKGFPGPFSHYAFKTIGCDGILRLMLQSSNREAHFESVIAYADHEGRVETFIGKLQGVVSSAIKGEGGFGFDPVFVPAGSTITLGEMTIESKCEVSHRRRSLEAFTQWLEGHI